MVSDNVSTYEGVVEKAERNYVSENSIRETITPLVLTIFELAL